MAALCPAGASRSIAPAGSTAASVELDDLLQAGGIGLLNAVERYDALQGTAFTTYAVQRIRGAMLDELRSRDWVPRSVRRNAREVAQAIGNWSRNLAATPRKLR